VKGSRIARFFEEFARELEIIEEVLRHADVLGTLAGEESDDGF
jgi:hypothetical protein